MHSYIVNKVAVRRLMVEGKGEIHHRTGHEGPDGE